MKKILTVFWIILLLLLISFCIFAIHSNIQTIIDLKALFPEHHTDLIKYNFIEIIFYVMTFFIFLINALTVVLVNFNFLNFTRYTYEEYKAIMDKKKADKQEKKKLKLQRQLNSLDKTE